MYINLSIHIWLNIIDIFFVYVFFVNPFGLPYWSYDIRLQLFDKSSIISYFSSTSCPTLGHHQRRMYYKSDVTFMCTLLRRTAYVLLYCVAFTFRICSINNGSSWSHLSILALKLILLSLDCMFLICSASRMYRFCLLFWCSKIVVFSVIIFRNSVVGHEYFLNAVLWNLYQKGAL